MLSPISVATIGKEELVQGALNFIRAKVEDGCRRNALRKILRSQGYPKSVIKEVISSIFDDDGDDVIEMANFRT